MYVFICMIAKHEQFENENGTSVNNVKLSLQLP